jgi:hypothetical protein
MRIRILGEQHTAETGSVKTKEFTFETEVDKLERLSGIRLMEMPSRKEGESLEEHMMAIEDEKERFFSELDAYIAKVFGIMENELIRVKTYTIY